MSKTTHRFDWSNGYTTAKRLRRSFDTLEAATAFADGKATIDIYKSKGRYTVEWVKTTPNNN